MGWGQPVSQSSPGCQAWAPPTVCGGPSVNTRLQTQEQTSSGCEDSDNTGVLSWDLAQSSPQPSEGGHHHRFTKEETQAWVKLLLTVPWPESAKKI